MKTVVRPIERDYVLERALTGLHILKATVHSDESGLTRIVLEGPGKQVIIDSEGSIWLKQSMEIL